MIEASTVRELLAECFSGEWGDDPGPNDGTPVLRSTNFGSDGTLDLSDVVTRRIGPGVFARKRLLEGDILLEKSGGGPQQPVGRVTYFNHSFDATCSNFMQVCRSKQENDPRYVFYLFYFLYVSGITLRFQQQTTGLINLNLREFLNCQVSRPEKSEQEGITLVLSTLDRAIEQTELLLDKNKRLMTGLTRDLLTMGIDAKGRLRNPSTHSFKPSDLGPIPSEWTIRTLADIVPANRPIVYGILMPGEFFEKGVPVIKVKDIQDGQVQTEDLLKTDPKIDAAYARSRLRGGDLLFSIRGSVGRMAIVPPELEGANITQDTARISVGVGNTTFIRHCLEMPKQRVLIELHTIGQAVKGINLADVRRIPVQFPDPEEQNQIADRLIAKDQELQILTTQLQKLRRMKLGLMQDLFTGRTPVAPVIRSRRRVGVAEPETTRVP